MFVVSTFLLALSSHQVIVSRVIDGDTFKTDVPRCYLEEYCSDVSVRVRGVDTPELRSKDPCERESAIRARDSVSDLFHSGQNRVYLSNIGRDNFGRILADVLVKTKPKTKLAEFIKDNNLEKIYCE